MDVQQAIDRAKNNDDVRKLKDYFLCSCFACIKQADEKINQWTLLYFNPGSNKVVDCFVNDKFVTVGDETPPLGEIEKPDFSQIKIPIEDAIDTAARDYRKSLINVLITLHQKGTLVWTINFISPDMMAKTVDVDAKTGKVLREEETSLVRRL